jgi:hypothetical protein
MNENNLKNKAIKSDYPSASCETESDSKDNSEITKNSNTKKISFFEV